MTALPVLVLARLTIKEAARRRLFLVVGVLTLVLIAFTAWGFERLTSLPCRAGRPCSPTEVKALAATLLILLMFMYSFVFAVGAVFMAVSAIQPEIESGVLLAMVPRPIRRSDVVLGRWLGLAAVVAAYVTATSALEFWVVATVVDYTPPRPEWAIVSLIAESLVMLTLGLLCSTRLSPIVGGIVALVLFGVCWMGGIVRGVGVALDSDLLRGIGTVTSLVLPTDGLWRSALFNLEPTLLTSVGGGNAMAANPFLTPTGPSPEYLAWAAAWLVGVLGAAVVSFARREL